MNFSFNDSKNHGLVSYSCSRISYLCVCTEIEFLDSNLTKRFESLLYAIVLSPFCRWILKNTLLFSGFEKILTKKSAKQENSSLLINIIL
jgi:hypothetical protein